MHRANLPPVGPSTTLRGRQLWLLFGFLASLAAPGCSKHESRAIRASPSRRPCSW